MPNYPVPITLYNRYGPLFHAKSFKSLREIVIAHLDCLTEKGKAVVDLRFNKALSMAMIGEALIRDSSTVCYNEQSSLERILHNYNARKMLRMKRSAVLDMDLSTLAGYIPYTNNIRQMHALRFGLSRTEGIKVRDLVEMGRSAVSNAVVSDASYTHLAEFLGRYSIQLPPRVILRDHVMNHYFESFGVTNFAELQSAIPKYEQFLTKVETAVLKMRMQGNSLRDLEGRFGMTYERVRRYEGRALAQVRFYRSKPIQPKKSDLLAMRVSDFADLLPPHSGDTGQSRVRTVLMKEFGDKDISYLVHNPHKMAQCANFSAKSYGALVSALKHYNVALRDVDEFMALKRHYTKHHA